MARLFVSQERLDTWVSQSFVELVEDRMTMEGGRTLRLAPAVLVVALIGDDGDPHDLVGRVKTKAQLKTMGAEHYMDSVILGDVGYEVRQGFLGEPITP